MQPGEHLLIFGASARAAAFSALRAGLSPWCADLFADADLLPRCPAMRLPGRYPDSFLDLVKADIPGPWMYTGGLENHPRLIQQMEQHRWLWGADARVLSRIRDPDVLTFAARAAGLPAPLVSWQRLPPHPGRWLSKPLKGSSGIGIRFWSEESSVKSGESYLQQYIEGDPASAVYVGAGQVVSLLGVSRQLVGEAFLRAPPFRYCGNIGPLPVSDELQQGLLRLGSELVHRTAIRGLFGVDGILSEGTFWPVEVNPRYTASVEVLEYATGMCALDQHRRAFEERPLSPIHSQAGSFVGKAILYARSDGVFPVDGPWREVLDAHAPVQQMPAFADLPHPGDDLQRGRPVLTFFTTAPTFDACLAQLHQKAAEVESLLYP